MEFTMKIQFLRAANVAALFYKRALFMGIIVGLIGCPSNHLVVQSSTDPLSTLRLYETYQIHSLNNPDLEFIPLVNNAIAQALDARGYKQSSTNSADLIIKYKIKIRHDEQLRMEPIAEQNNVYTRATTESIDEASMLVNAIDSKTNNVIWKAYTIRNLHDVNKKTPMIERVRVGISEIFADFPTK